LPDTGARDRALAKLIRWVRSQPDSEARNQALTNCIDELAKTDLPAALALAESLPDAAGRGTLIVRLWIQAGPLAVSDWINRLGLPPEIMSPRQASWPWKQPFPNFQRKEIQPRMDTDGHGFHESKCAENPDGI
jgi:hypothetical protein